MWWSSHDHHDGRGGWDYAPLVVNVSNLSNARSLGTPVQPRRRFVAPVEVGVAEALLLVRVVVGVGLVLLATTQPLPAGFTVPGAGYVALPGAATWNALAPWVVAGSVFEGALVMRLGGLRAGSRRVILMLEAIAIATSGAYAAAGLKVALVPLVAAITAVVLLRLDHVRHSFELAGVARRVRWQSVTGVLYNGYAPADPLAPIEVQRIGYRVGVDGPRPAPRAREMSRT